MASLIFGNLLYKCCWRDLNWRFEYTMERNPCLPYSLNDIHQIWQLLHNLSNCQIKMTAKYSGYMVIGYHTHSNLWMTTFYENIKNCGTFLKINNWITMTTSYFSCFAFENILFKISDSQLFRKIFHSNGVQFYCIG